MNFKEVSELPYPLFLMYRKDSWICNLRKSEEGREILHNIWRLQQTKADTKAVHEFQQKGGNA